MAPQLPSIWHPCRGSRFIRQSEIGSTFWWHTGKIPELHTWRQTTFISQLWRTIVDKGNSAPADMQKIPQLTKTEVYRCDDSSTRSRSLRILAGWWRCSHCCFSPQKAIMDLTIFLFFEMCRSTPTDCRFWPQTEHQIFVYQNHPETENPADSIWQDVWSLAQHLQRCRDGVNRCVGPWSTRVAKSWWLNPKKLPSGTPWPSIWHRFCGSMCIQTCASLSLSLSIYIYIHNLIYIL